LICIKISNINCYKRFYHYFCPLHQEFNKTPQKISNSIVYLGVYLYKTNQTNDLKSIIKQALTKHSMSNDNLLIYDQLLKYVIEKEVET
jgi:hypothetical protein